MDAQTKTISQAQFCIIWLHGLGADSSDMIGLADQLLIPQAYCKHVFLDAPIRSVTVNNGAQMTAWYDIVGFGLLDREDAQGITESAQQLKSAIDAQMAEGFSSKQIFLAGFSQGAAMALYTGLHYAEPLAGIVVLSGYLPMAAQIKPQLPKNTPIFIACGRFDPIVQPQWTKITTDWLKDHEYSKIAFHEYPMPHSVCHEEIADLSCWLMLQAEGDK